MFGIVGRIMQVGRRVRINDEKRKQDKDGKATAET